MTVENSTKSVTNTKGQMDLKFSEILRHSDLLAHLYTASIS